MIKKTENWKTDAFGLWCWRNLLRVPWTARRSNQSILKEISPEYSLEGLILKLNLQYFGYLMGRENSLEKTLMLGKTKGKRRRGWQRMWWLNSITNSWREFEQTLRNSRGKRSLVCCSPWGCRVGHNLVTAWQHNIMCVCVCIHTHVHIKNSLYTWIATVVTHMGKEGGTGCGWW